MEAVISKWGNSSAVRLPRPYLQKLGIKDNDTVKIGIRGNIITIEKPFKIRSFRELVQDETGMDLEQYVQKNPYYISDYLEFGRVGSEEI